MKTNRKDEYFSLGIVPGQYKVTLLQDNKELFHFNGVVVSVGDNLDAGLLNFDLKKEQAAAAAQAAGSTPGQSKQQVSPAELELVKTLNQKLLEAKAASDANQFQKAVEVLESAIELDSTRHQLWASLANAQSKLATQDSVNADALYRKSVEGYKKAISLLQASNPHSTVLGAYYNNLGQGLGKLRLFDEELTAFSQAAVADPANAKTYYFNMGATVHNVNSKEPAPAAFNKIAFRLILKAYGDSAGSGFSAMKGSQLEGFRNASWATLELPGSYGDCLISNYGGPSVFCTLGKGSSENELLGQVERLTSQVREVFPDWKLAELVPPDRPGHKLVGPASDVDVYVSKSATKGCDVTVMVLSH